MDLLEHDGEDGVGARRGVVHFRGGGGPIVVAKSHVAKKFSVILHWEICKVFDVGTFGGRFADFEIVGIGGRRLSRRCKKISDMLIVDFEVRDSNGVGDVGRYARFDALEEVLASSWDETWLLMCTHHCVRLTGASLTVGKDTCVVAFEVMVQKFFPKRVVYVFLVCVMRICRIV